MKFSSETLALIAAWAASMTVHAPVLAQTPEIAWQTQTLHGAAEVPILGEVGRLQVPARHTDPNGPRFEVSFVRFRTDHPRPRATIFFLAGGPGGSGIELSAKIATHPQLRLLEHADVIGIDQRGTGLSRPNLMEPEFTEELPWNQSASRDHYLAAFQRCVQKCVAHCESSKIDIGAFNTEESCHDIESVRQALRLEKIVLFGSSYGSHLGLAYLAKYPQHVDRAVLTKVEGLAQTWKYPHSVQRVFEHVNAICRNDSDFASRFSSLHEAILQLRERLRTEQIRVPVRDETSTVREIVLSEYELLMAVANWISETDGIAKLPARIAQCLDGDWTSIAEFAKDSRRISIQAMPLFVDCASGASAERIQQIEQERADPGNLLQDALVAPFFFESCEGCGRIDLGDQFRSEVNCSVPILFVSGTLDVRTPPENVEAMLSSFPQAAHIIVHNAGHDSRELMSIEYRRLLQGFLRGQQVTSTEFTLPQVLFENVRKARAP